MAKDRLTLYQKVKRAAMAGRPVTLTHRQAHLLYEMDRAFKDRADCDDMGIMGVDGDDMTEAEIRTMRAP